MTSRDLLDRDPLGPRARRQVAEQRRYRAEVDPLDIAFDLVLLATVLVVVLARLIAGGGS